MKRSSRRRVPRGYSTEFKPKARGARYLLDRIPEELWDDVQHQAKAERISVRYIILKLLRDWVDTPF